MKILLLSWENFGTEDIKEALISVGHEVHILKTSQEELLSTKIADKILKTGTDTYTVFGFNYFPEVAKACKELNIDYYSWVYDNPCIQLYSFTVMFPTNHIFVFDSDTYLRFAGQGINTIEYMPLAANPNRLSKLTASSKRYKYDLSFVGSLYTEEHNFYERMIKKGISPYTEGFLRGLMDAQKLIYGSNIIEDKLTKEVYSDMHRALPLEPDSDSVILPQTLFTEYVINRQITAEERADYLNSIGKTLIEKKGYASNDSRLALFTRDKSAKISGFDNHGSIDFYEGAPQVFASSKINLNISLRSIVNGIPLRCFEIMGSGGFLLTNYAGDFEHFFVEGEDYVAFESPEDMLEKVIYYLEHDEEREAIARSGYEKICAGHTFVHRVLDMIPEV